MYAVEKHENERKTIQRPEKKANVTLFSYCFPHSSCCYFETWFCFSSLFVLSFDVITIFAAGNFSFIFRDLWIYNSLFFVDAFFSFLLLLFLSISIFSHFISFTVLRFTFFNACQYVCFISMLDAMSCVNDAAHIYISLCVWFVVGLILTQVYQRTRNEHRTDSHSHIIHDWIANVTKIVSIKRLLSFRFLSAESSHK